jgi:DNA mismatch endonuclease (patch repair protein)
LEEASANSGQAGFLFSKAKGGGVCGRLFLARVPRCYRLPKQNRAFWKAKIEGNRRRDRSVNGRLRRLGWKVMRIKECQLKHADRVVVRIKNALR